MDPFSSVLVVSGYRVWLVRVCQGWRYLDYSTLTGDGRQMCYDAALGELRLGPRVVGILAGGCWRTT